MTAPAGLASTLVLVDAQAAARQRVTANVLAALARAFGLLRGGGFYDRAAVEEYVSAMSAAVTGGRQMVAGSTDAYLRAQLGQLGARPPKSTAPPAELPRGIPLGEEFVRPVKEYRYARFVGLDELIAEDRAAERAQRIAEMDLALAARDTAHDLLSRTAGVTGFRRVLHPELNRQRAGGHAVCGLCIAASDRVYSRGDLLPIHDGDYCEVASIVGKHGGDGDPGQSLNAESLGQLYAAAGDTAAAALKRTRWTVEQHGELGPVLRAAGDSFRGPDEVAHDLNAADQAD